MIRVNRLLDKGVLEQEDGAMCLPEIGKAGYWTIGSWTPPADIFHEVLLGIYDKYSIRPRKIQSD